MRIAACSPRSRLALLRCMRPRHIRSVRGPPNKRSTRSTTGSATSWTRTGARMPRNATRAGAKPRPTGSPRARGRRPPARAPARSAPHDGSTRRRRPAQRRGCRTAAPRSRTRARGGARPCRRDRSAAPARRSSGAGDTRRRANPRDASALGEHAVVDVYHHDSDDLIDNDAARHAIDVRRLHLHPARGHEAAAGRRRPRSDQRATAGPDERRVRPRPGRRYVRCTYGGGCRRVPAGERSLRRRCCRSRNRIRAERFKRGLTPIAGRSRGDGDARLAPRHDRRPGCRRGHQAASEIDPKRRKAPFPGPFSSGGRI